MNIDEIPLGHAENLAGCRFGRLTALYRAIPPNNSRYTYWKCQCDCGNTKIIRASSLKDGTTKSCGCYQKEFITQKNFEKGGGDLTGQRFGRLTVMDFVGYKTYKSGRRRLWKCKCDCGKEKIIEGASLRNGDTTSCGCYQKEKALFTI